MRINIEKQNSGRPSKLFETGNSKSKKRKIFDVSEKSVLELIEVLVFKFRQEHHYVLANLLPKLLNVDKKILNKISSTFETEERIKQIDPHNALKIFINLKLSKAKYICFKSFFKSNTDHILPAYETYQNEEKNVCQLHFKTC